MRRSMFRTGSKAALLVVAVVVFTVALSWGIWYFGVKTSGVRGAGDAERDKNSALNRVSAQEQYVAVLNDVKAADDKVTLAYEDLQLDPSSEIKQTTLNGTKNYCVSAVADYNGLSDKYTSADFRPEGYPETLDGTDPETDCKEDVK